MQAEDTSAGAGGGSSAMGAFDMHRGARGNGGSNNGGPKSVRVLVEMRLPRERADAAFASLAAAPSPSGFRVDSSYKPVPMGGGADAADASRAGQPGASGRAGAAGESIVVVRGTVDEDRIAELEAQPNVRKVWRDGPIAPFAPPPLVQTAGAASAAPTAPEKREPLGPGRALGEPGLEQTTVAHAARAAVRETIARRAVVLPVQGFATCPIGTCDCSPGTPKGTIAEVAAYLGADQIWAEGFRGTGIVVGVVDGGITAEGRPIRRGEEATVKVGRVIGGFPDADWGTTGAAWGNHGNMCATDVLGMAPEAQIYDLRISDGFFLSDAMAAFQWAIDRHRADGTPHVLTNSWGIFQEDWAPDYARDPDHVFTRKVLEAMDEGILVLFAAGNCGGTCPDGRCGSDTGPGRSIWGANGHRRTITVGAVNKNEQFVGYSSQGPAALWADKPDFCSVTHFRGYFASDSGTSAATPIAAGVSALLRQAAPGLTQDRLQQVLKDTAKDIGPVGFDSNSGAGILRAKAAFDQLVVREWSEWEDLGGITTEGPSVASWSPGRLDCFVKGSDNHMYHMGFDGAWSGWEDLGGVIDGAPAAVSWDGGRIDCFARGMDNHMYHKWFDGTWSDWEDLGGVITAGPAVCSWAPGRLDCFAKGADNRVYHKWFDGSWSDWESLGGVIDGQPAAVSWANGRIDLFARGMDNHMYHKWFDGAWSDWEDLGGIITAGPAVSSWGNGRLDCFAKGADNHMYHKWFDGGWSDWEDLGGVIDDAPTAVSWDFARIDCFVRGLDGHMYHKWYA
jgi:hypothetical protein